MEIKETPLLDCKVIHLDKHGDDRGFFLESFNQNSLESLGLGFEVKQVNFAKSGKNVLRGLHYQVEPYAQSKIVGAISGAVLDVVVDLRKGSATYLKHFKLKIDNPETLLLVPRGFAHGYLTLEENTIFHYAVDNFYSAEHEQGVRYNDPVLKIDWEYDETPMISQKDLNQPYLNI